MAPALTVAASGEMSPPRTLLSRTPRAILRAIIVIYSAAILYFVWLSRDLTFATFARDPLFAGYSIAVVCYVMSRFVIALFYRPFRDIGHRATVSIIVPAFNEEQGILGTIESCLAGDYPPALVQVIVVNDGSSDGTWQRMLDAKERYPQITLVDLGRNYGKRAAMAEGFRRSTGDILLFVDSDSYLARDGVHQIVQPFADARIGAVVGHAEVANAGVNWLTKMQQVRYYAAFRVIKGTESMLGGTVTCASGCCSAYRRSAIAPLMDAWEFQTFLGLPATFGDDRALTNRVLRGHRVVYQSTARASTNVPETLRVFLRQQLRWKKSWLRESMYVASYFWRKHPVAAVLTYASIVFPFLAPFVVLNALGKALAGGTSGLWFYLIGTYAMALLYSLYYAYQRRVNLWHHGMTFIGIYMAFLVFQTYWGIVKMRDNGWGTRTSNITQTGIDPDLLTILAGRPLAAEEAA